MSRFKIKKRPPNIIQVKKAVVGDRLNISVLNKPYRRYEPMDDDDNGLVGFIEVV